MAARNPFIHVAAGRNLNYHAFQRNHSEWKYDVENCLVKTRPKPRRQGQRAAGISAAIALHPPMVQHRVAILLSLVALAAAAPQWFWVSDASLGANPENTFTFFRTEFSAPPESNDAFFLKIAAVSCPANAQFRYFMYVCTGPGLKRGCLPERRADHATNDAVRLWRYSLGGVRRFSRCVADSHIFLSFSLSRHSAWCKL